MPANVNEYRKRCMHPDGRVIVMGASNEPFGFNMGMMLTRVRIIGSTQNGPEYVYEALD
jgi:hypothetical protein